MRKAIMFSDAHASADDEAGAARLAAFLRETCATAERLFILGDLFDFWFGPAQASLEPYRGILGRIRELSRSGVGVTFYRGNRDCYITAAIAREYGFRLVDDYSIENVCGAKVLICHGDKLCANDKNYIRASAVIRNPLTRMILTNLPKSLGRRLAVSYRWWSARAVAAKSQRVIGIDRDAVLAHFALGADVIVAGHSHKSLKSEVETPDGIKTLYSLGDFQSEGVYLECGDDGLVVRSYGVPLAAAASVASPPAV